VDVRLDAKLRLADLLFRLVRGSISDMDADDIARAREGVGDTPWVDRVLGARADGVTLHDRTIPGPAGDLPVRIYSPPGVCDPDRPVVVHFHGGGWVLGNLDQGTWLCSEVAARLHTSVVSVDYRLAPEHRFPAAVLDCDAATSWVHDHREAFGSRRDGVAVMGDSAGGNLAAVVARRARDGGVVAISHQVLVYPATDVTQSMPSVEALRHAPILSRDDMDTFVAHYLSDDVDRRDPDLSPLWADDLTGVAPALVITAEYDPLKDEGEAYAQRLAAAGVPVRLTEYAGMVHGFTTFPGLASGARQALWEVVDFLADAPAVRPGVLGTR
jgi:acetyl esterase